MDTTKNDGKLGQMVTYVSTKGYEKAAMVVGTPESILPGHDYPVPAEGQRHLLVFALSGISPRLNVPESGTVDAESGVPTVAGVWR